MARRFRRRKVYPLLNLNCIWRNDTKYPDTIRIAMMDGLVIRYHPDFTQTAPHIVPEDWDRRESVIVGYQYGKTARDGNHERLKQGEKSHADYTISRKGKSNDYASLFQW